MSTDYQASFHYDSIWSSVFLITISDPETRLLPLTPSLSTSAVRDGFFGSSKWSAKRGTSVAHRRGLQIRSILDICNSSGARGSPPAKHQTLIRLKPTSSSVSEQRWTRNSGSLQQSINYLPNQWYSRIDNIYFVKTQSGIHCCLDVVND